MGISVADNFDHKSKKPLDARTSYATTALMKAVTDANMNEGCLAYCDETDKYYKFLSSNTVDETLGKWREWAGGGGGTSDYSDLSNKPSINNVTLSGNKTNSDLGLASLPTIKSATLSSGSTSVQFTDVPTTGDKLISVFTKIGLEYDSMSQSGSTVTVYYPAQSSDVTVYMKIEDV